MNRKVFRILAFLAVAPILQASEIQTELKENQSTVVHYSRYDYQAVIKLFKESLQSNSLNNLSIQLIPAMFDLAILSLQDFKENELKNINDDNSKQEIIERRNYQMGKIFTYYSYILDSFLNYPYQKYQCLERGKKIIRHVLMTTQSANLKKRALFFAWYNKFASSQEENDNFLKQSAELGFEKAVHAQQLLLVDSDFKESHGSFNANDNLFTFSDRNEASSLSKLIADLVHIESQ